MTELPALRAAAARYRVLLAVAPQSTPSLEPNSAELATMLRDLLAACAIEQDRILAGAENLFLADPSTPGAYLQAVSESAEAIFAAALAQEQRFSEAQARLAEFAHALARHAPAAA